MKQQQFKVEITIEDEGIPPGSIGLLLPVPPRTADQEPTGLVLDPAWRATLHAGQNPRQSALFAQVPADRLHRPIRFEVGLRDGPLVEEHFDPSDGPSTAPQGDAQALLDSLQIPDAADELERLRRIVDCLADKFDYTHDRKGVGALTCDLLSGNCFDINAALMKLLRLAGIKHVYYIGYFVEDGQPFGRGHCWVSTVTSAGYQSWDIAHHLKRDLGRTEPSLNPIPGTRVAMSTGWDLVFHLAGTRVEIPHLVLPRWVFPDGTSRDCKVQMRLIPMARADREDSSEQSLKSRNLVI